MRRFSSSLAAACFASAVAVAGCDSNAITGRGGSTEATTAGGGASNQLPGVFQQPVAGGIASGVAESASYRMVFSLGGDVPTLEGEDVIVNPAVTGEELRVGE